MSKTILAIIVIGALEFYALHKGIDGQCLAISFACIGGLAGYNLKKILNHFKKEK